MYSLAPIPSNPGVPVHLVVTVEARKGQERRVINREDVIVHEGRDRDEAIDWVPAQGEHATLKLMILLDDGSNTTLGTQLDDIRNFINSQPDTTMIVSLICAMALLKSFRI
jgi:hypothetical protein